MGNEWEKTGWKEGDKYQDNIILGGVIKDRMLLSLTVLLLDESKDNKRKQYFQKKNSTDLSIETNQNDSNESKFDQIGRIRFPEWLNWLTIIQDGD